MRKHESCFLCPFAYRTKKEGEIRNAHRFSGNSTGNRHFITLVSSGIRAQGNNRLLARKDYLKTAFIYGFCYTCVLIIVTEIIWDSIADRLGLSGITRDILSSFLRAALLEETFKFTGFLLAKRSLKLTRKIDFIMIAGLIGLVYGVVEKAVLGNIAAVVIGLLIPMHITWQFNQGGHWFEYEKTRSRGELLMATAVPFLFHGCWDSGLDLVVYLFGMEESAAAQAGGGVLLVAMLALGVVYTVRTLKKVRAVARSASKLE